MTYKDALKYLETFINYEQIMRYPYESAYKLQRMQLLCKLAGDPQATLKCVHIGGTKGKGSVSAMTESILRAAGYKTGLYTSPHLGSIRERIRIAGEPISQSDFARFTGMVKKALDAKKINARYGAYTFFEVVTLLAFLVFARKKVDVAVLEVGLGGRLDATNVITPLAVGLAPVSFEHASILGVTLERIAREKCGIFKDEVPVVSARQPEVVHGVIKEVSSARRAPRQFVSKHIRVKRNSFNLRSQRMSCQGPWKTNYGNLELGLLGMHQVKNAGIAIGLVEALKERKFRINTRHVQAGLKNVTWPGRLEVIGKDPRIILDGAQNADSARALMLAIKEYFKFKKLVVLLGISNDKDFEGVGKTICSQADEVIFTEADHTRSASANFLDTVLGGLCHKRRAIGDVREAIATARKLTGPDDLILVTGSLYLVGLARRILLGNGKPADVSVGRF